MFRGGGSCAEKRHLLLGSRLGFPIGRESDTLYNATKRLVSLSSSMDASMGFHAILTFAASCRHISLFGFTGNSTYGDGAGVGGSASSVNVTFLSIHDFQPRPLARPGQSQLADWNNTTTAEPSLYC